MNIYHIIAAVLASFRITELLIMDKITEKLRIKFPSYLWSCSRCVSVWAGIIVTILFIWYPYANWPFAFAWMYLWHNDWITAKRIRKSRQLLVEVDEKGLGKILRSELSSGELSQLIDKLKPKV